jgi:tetratricopeptide (TPR) repeat protein
MGRCGRGRAGAATSAVVCAVACLAAASAHGEKKKPGLFDFQSWKTPAQRQRDAAKDLAPGALDLTPLAPFDAPVRVARVRVYADRDYRAGVLHWREKARAQIERVNDVLEPVFDVRLELESLREWDESHAGVALEPVLAALETRDGARDVDWVVGFVTPFRGVATSIHQIGVARLASRAFIMRGMDDEQEGRALEREFSMLSEGERERLYGNRKAHKEVVMFLHEWAHTMGALHVEEREMLMNPAYDPKQAAFSDFEKRLIGLVLDARLGDRSHAYPETAKLLALVAEAPREEGSDRDRDELAALLRRRAGGAPAPGGAAGSPKAGANAPTPPAVPASPKLRAAIEQAMERLRADDLAGATPLVLDAAKKVGEEPADTATLVKLAAAAGTVGAISTADAVLARVDRGARPSRLVNELEATRARVALPREAAKLGIAPEAEPRYVAAFLTASDTVASRNFAAAERRLAELADAFPESAGRDVVACELAVARKRFADAEARCAAALAKDPGALRAHLGLARVCAGTRRTPDAEKHFRRAILLDPSDDTAWIELGQLYRRTGASTQYDQLAREHEAVLQRPLPHPN